MALFHRLAARAAENHGLVTSADASELGGSPMALLMLSKRGVVVPVARGIFRVSGMTDQWTQFQEVLLRTPGAVISHGSAMDLHDLADVNPWHVHMSVPRGRRLRGALPQWLIVHQSDLAPRDTTWVEGLAITTPVRTILDAIADHLRSRFVDEAIDTARQRDLLSASDEERVTRASEAAFATRVARRADETHASQ